MVGLRALWAYAGRPGDVAVGPVTWPGQSSITHDAGRATLVMFVHPMCPCSRASIEQLSRLMARTGEALTVKVVAICPKDAPGDWEDSTLLRSIRAIPGAELVYDRSGEEAKRFGAMTSGHVALYDRRGTLMFTGGITASRGHAGDNAGADAVVALVRNASPPAKHTQTPVYGCLLPGQRFDQPEQDQHERGNE